MKPETREILQCLYAPRAPGEGEAPAPKPEGIGDAFTKLSLLGAPLDRLVDPELFLLTAIEAGVPEALAEAAAALARGDRESAASLLLPIPVDEVAKYARALAAMNAEAAVPNNPAPPPSSNWDDGTAIGAAGNASDLQSPSKSAAKPWVIDLSKVNFNARTMIDAILEAAEVDPLGCLHLERLHFTPIALRRGDLVYSVPLMPGETVRLTHREWSRTEQEYTSLVSSSMESEQENALSEKSELAESTNVQQSHSMAFTASASASGQLGLIHIAASAGINIARQASESRDTSVRRSREATRKASSRAKQEHKVTFRTLHADEREDTNYRELSNQTDEAQRWDFHRVMREWDVKLYRYGSRLTYDITVPEPGAYLLRLHRRRLDIRKEMADPLILPSIDEVQAAAHPDLMRRYNLPLDPPPRAYTITATNIVECTSDWDRTVAAAVELVVPEGYKLGEPVEFYAVEAGLSSRTESREQINRQAIIFAAITGNYSWPYSVTWSQNPKPGMRAVASIHTMVKPLDATVDAWRARTHAAIIEALKAGHESKLAALRKEDEDIEQRIGAADPLSLRRIEREELMKSILRWAVGSVLPERPPGFGASGDRSEAGDDDLNPDLTEEERRSVLQHGHIVSFVHQAIEWENVSFVLYPYFWGGDWELKQPLQHPDDAHCQFLRAGAARVVLPVRHPFEWAWLNFSATGIVGKASPYSDTYREIASEIHDQAKAYQQAADEEGTSEAGTLIGRWSEWTPTAALEVVKGLPLES